MFTVSSYKVVEWCISDCQCYIFAFEHHYKKVFKFKIQLNIKIRFKYQLNIGRKYTIYLDFIICNINLGKFGGPWYCELSRFKQAVKAECKQTTPSSSWHCGVKQGDNFAKAALQPQHNHNGCCSTSRFNNNINKAYRPLVPFVFVLSSHSTFTEQKLLLDKVLVLGLEQSIV